MFAASGQTALKSDGDNKGSTGCAGKYINVNQVVFIAYSQTPPKVDGKMLRKKEAHNVLQA